MYCIVETGMTVRKNIESIEAAKKEAEKYLNDIFKDRTYNTGEYVEVFINDQEVDKSVVKLRIDIVLTVDEIG